MIDDTKANHSLILDSRSALHISGVCDVSSFDENVVVMETVQGGLTVKGQGLHISGFNKETGDLSMEGSVYLLGYTDNTKKDSSLIRRLFK